MRISDFDLYQELLIKESGLSLTPDKSYLLDSRLTPVAKKWGYNSLDEMTVAMRGVPEPELINDVVEAMTSSETSFFRDGKPFEIFGHTVLPYMSKNRSKQRAIRIWCAACSSGQEPYSLAMTILENQKLVPGWNIEILATDLSNSILDKARSAEFTQFEVQRGLPVQILLKYFEQSRENWKLKDEVRKMINFQHFNLLDDMDALGQFDIILCRNVLTCFEDETKSRVLANMAGTLNKDGFLFLGDTETMTGLSEEFQPMNGHGLYILSGGNYNIEELGTAAAQ